MSHAMDGSTLDPAHQVTALVANHLLRPLGQLLGGLRWHGEMLILLLPKPIGEIRSEESDSALAAGALAGSVEDSREPDDG